MTSGPAPTSQSLPLSRAARRVSDPPHAASLSLPTAHLYIFSGPDRYRKRARIEQLAGSLGIELLDRHEIAAGQVSTPALLALCREQPAASPFKLVVIDEAERLEDVALRQLAAHAPTVASTACIVLVMGKGLTPDHLLGAHAKVEDFGWLPPAEVGRWIQQYVAACGKRIEGPLVQALLSRHGGDLAAIQMALDQLLAWTQQAPQLRYEDFAQLSGKDDAQPGRGPQLSPAKSGFALAEAIARRDAAGALYVIHEQMTAGKEIVELVGLVVWQLQRWVTVGRLVEAGVMPAQISALTGVQPWQLERVRRELSGRSVAWLMGMLRRCWQLDQAAKSGRAIPRLGFEQFVVELCGRSVVPNADLGEG